MVKWVVSDLEQSCLRCSHVCDLHKLQWKVEWCLSQTFHGCRNCDKIEDMTIEVNIGEAYYIGIILSWVGIVFSGERVEIFVF